MSSLDQMDAIDVLEVIFKLPPHKGARKAVIDLIRGDAQTLVGLMKILSCGGIIDQAMLNKMERLGAVERTLLAGWVSAGFQGKDIFEPASSMPIEMLLSGKGFVHQGYSPRPYFWEASAEAPDVHQL